MRHLGLFEGIGGFSLAARWMGWETVAWCEWNPFCQQALRYHFPEAEGFGDITKTDFTKYANKIDILTGGFPCQPYSLAGKRKGKDDERHLWPHMLRAIREVRPRWVVGENVFGLVNWNGGLVFEEVQADLEAEGYEVQPFILPACGVGAPHRRDRVWFVGYAKHNGYATPQEGRNEQKPSFEAEQDKVREFTGANSLWAGNVGNANGDRESEVGKFYEWGRSEESTQPCRISKNDAANSNSVTRRQQPKFTSSDAAGAREKFDRSGIDAPNRTNSRFKSLPKSEIGIHGLELTPNANSGRQSSQEYRKKESGWITEKSVSGDWENFPTQSPICGRNDGIPPELAGITVSKHRNESIKAYGNAIVPQVALQIFKAIENYDNTTSISK